MSGSINTLDHILPNLYDWPISIFSKRREEFIKELVDFTFERLTTDNFDAQQLLSKSIYLERQRVKNNPWSVDPPDEKVYWKSLGKELDQAVNSDNSEKEVEIILKRLINRYSQEIVGEFYPNTFKFARKFLTGLFKRLFNNGWGRGHKGIWGSKEELLEKFVINGYVDEVRTLFQKGTVVIVPTHYSNLDSILIGYAIDAKVGIPAFSYGAGLNLYDYEILAYYMNRLGAYRVDRRKKNPIYLETLKSMASLSLSEGLNHIFFPGGTRSRSGSIEDKLKLGLLNSVVDAQRYSFQNGVGQKIFIVPLTISYHFVLEAKSLIVQHLRREGREKYVRSRKRNSLLKIIWKFLWSLRRYDSEVFLTFGKPMDVIGNFVTPTGDSVDERGNPVTVKNYFKSGHQLKKDLQRESVYTRYLSNKIIKSFKSEHTVLSSHLLAFAMFSLIEESNPELDMYQIIRIPPNRIRIKTDRMLKRIGHYQEILLAKEQKGDLRLSEKVRLSPEECFDDGLAHLGIYHLDKPLKKLDDKFMGTEDLELLLYYHNKLIPYDLPKKSTDINLMATSTLFADAE